MTRSKELSDPNSCFSKAKEDEPMFVLLARDVMAPDIVREWCRQRIKFLNQSPADEQIKEAMAIAQQMEEWKANHRD